MVEVNINKNLDHITIRRRYLPRTILFKYVFYKFFESYSYILECYKAIEDMHCLLKQNVMESGGWGQGGCEAFSRG